MFFFLCFLFIFFFNDTATTEIYTLSLHDALPIITISDMVRAQKLLIDHLGIETLFCVDRKSTRLNSSHANLVCRLLLEKKKYTPPITEAAIKYSIMRSQPKLA